MEGNGISSKSQRNISNDKQGLLMFCILVFVGIFILFAYGIGNVSAENPSNIYVSTHGNDSWSGLNSTYKGGVNGPKATITNATKSVAPGGTVYLDSGTYNENNIVIDTNISIIGQNGNTIINGTNPGSVFIIMQGTDVYIDNLTLKNGNSVMGAIYNNGDLILNNCTFTDNSASDGGAIYNSGTLTVKDSILDGNSGSINGGSIYNTGTLDLLSTNFINNTVTTSDGGAIYSEGVLTADNCNFTGNSVTTDDGGAIYNYGNAIIDNNNFTDNSGNMGGAIYNFNNLNVSNSFFTDNCACDGGACVDEGNSKISNTSFLYNSAMCSGGAIIIFNNCNLDVQNSTFMGNTANFGGVMASYGTVNINESDLEDNKATQWGGVLSNYGTAKIQYSRIIDNTANSGNAIYGYDNKTDISLNWWGSNNAPVNEVYGSVTIAPWIILNISSNSTIPLNSNSTVTADMVHDSNGVYHDPANGHVPNGILTTFNTSSLSKKSYTSNGIIQYVFNGGSITELAKISVVTDNQSVQTFVKVIYHTANSENS